METVRTFYEEVPASRQAPTKTTVTTRTKPMQHSQSTGNFTSGAGSSQVSFQRPGAAAAASLASSPGPSVDLGARQQSAPRLRGGSVPDYLGGCRGSTAQLASPMLYGAGLSGLDALQLPGRPLSPMRSPQAPLKFEFRACPSPTMSAAAEPRAAELRARSLGGLTATASAPSFAPCMATTYRRTESPLRTRAPTPPCSRPPHSARPRVEFGSFLPGSSRWPPLETLQGTPLLSPQQQRALSPQQFRQHHASLSARPLPPRDLLRSEFFKF